MTTHEQHPRTDDRLPTDDADGGRDRFGESDAVSVEHDGADLLFSQHWTDIQSRFVDDPRDAAASADALVAEVMDSIGDR
jgi:hypothetical protein